MRFSQSLTEQLVLLSDAVDEPGADVKAIIDVLMDDVARAVPSFLGLTITIVVDGVPVLLGAIDQADLVVAGSSLRLPLRLSGSPPIGHVVMYAGTVNAFAELATYAHRFHQVTGQIQLDGDLVNIAWPPDTSGLSDQSDTDQAVGILIERGHLPEGARALLARAAAVNNSSLAAEARKLLGAIGSPGVVGGFEIDSAAPDLA